MAKSKAAYQPKNQKPKQPDLENFSDLVEATMAELASYPAAKELLTGNKLTVEGKPIEFNVKVKPSHSRPLWMHAFRVLHVNGVFPRNSPIVLSMAAFLKLHRISYESNDNLGPDVYPEPGHGNGLLFRRQPVELEDKATDPWRRELKYLEDKDDNTMPLMYKAMLGDDDARQILADLAEENAFSFLANFLRTHMVAAVAVPLEE